MGTLPYLSPLLIPFLALAYRCRGGFLSLSWLFSWWTTTEARLAYWAIPILLAILPVSFLWALPCGLLAYLSLLIPHGKWQGSCKFSDVAMMGLIGLIRFALILVPLSIFNPFVEIFALFGLLSGLGYYLGWKFFSTTNFLPVNYGGKVNYLCDGGSAFGELFTGAFFGLGMAGVWIYHAVTSETSLIMKIISFFI